MPWRGSPSVRHRFERRWRRDGAPGGRLRPARAPVWWAHEHTALRRDDGRWRGLPPPLRLGRPLDRGGGRGGPGRPRHRGGGAFPHLGHHVQRLRPSRRRGAADPLRPDPPYPVGPGMAQADARHRAARARDQRVPARHLPPPGDRARGPCPRGADRAQRRVRPAHDRRRAARRCLHPHRRHRHRAHRRGRVLRPGGQRAHPLGRQLHAREPRDDAANVPRALLALARGAGLGLPAASAAIAAGLRARDGCRAAHGGGADPRHPQLGLLRARLPGRADGRRAGRGAGPARAWRPGVHEDHRRLGAPGRALPAGWTTSISTR